MELLWKLSTFHIVSIHIQWNLLDRPKCKIRKIWFLLIFRFFIIKINHDVFLQRNKNISLNYYDFPNHFSALCFLEKNQERSVLQKTHTVGHLKINISRKYIMLVFFSEKCKKVNVMHTYV